jgi:hypothetical protein
MTTLQITKGLLAAVALVASAASFAGTTYRFTVTCPDRRVVETWETGAIDPGREYLRTITGTKYQGCSITDFNPDRDGRLPQNRHSDAGGVFDGLPPVQILKDIFHL